MVINRILLTLLGTIALSLSSYAQNCQGSFDHQDLYGQDDFTDGHFRCGTAMMEDRMYYQKMQREKKGFHDIDGLTFYDSQGYFQKKGKLYYSDYKDSFSLVSTGDVKSLELVGNFIRDKNYVYCNGRAQEIVDISSFRALEGTPFALDKNHVYYSASRAGLGNSDTIQILEGADPTTFSLICEAKNRVYCSYFARDNQHVFFQSKRVEGADPKTFVAEDNGYAHDKNFVYYNGEKLEGSSGSTFQRVNYYYMHDENQVYYYGVILPEMNGGSFQLLGDSGMGTDGTVICYRNNILKNGDPATFADIGCGYYRDKNNVYSKGQVLEGIDPATFEIMDWGFTKDKNGVYCDDGMIPDADPETFEILGRKYSRDKKHVFYLRTQLEKAARDTFVVDPIDHNRASDGKAVYLRGRVIEK